MLHLHRPTISEIEAGRRSVTAEEIDWVPTKIYAVTVGWLTSAPQDPAIDKLELAKAREWCQN